MTCTTTLPTDRSTNTVFENLNMSDFIQADFSAIHGVRDVRVSSTPSRISVEVYMSAFGKDVRRKVYAKQRAFYREFPHQEFSFYLVDESRSTLENAIS